MAEHIIIVASKSDERWASSTGKASAPVISTSAWKRLMSNRGPSSASALRRSRWMVSAPIL